MRGLRSRIARYHCPACGALQPYGSTRKLTFAAIDEKKPTTITCRSCKAEYKLHGADPASQAHARRIWGFASVAMILLGFAAFAVTRLLLPASMEWIAAVLGLVIGLLPLPYIEARSSRHLSVFKVILRRTRAPVAKEQV